MSLNNATCPLDKEGYMDIASEFQCLNGHEGKQMEVDEHDGSTLCRDRQEVMILSKAHHHLVKLSYFERNEEVFEANFLRIQKICNEELKINLLSCKTDLKKEFYVLSTETATDVEKIASCNFIEKGIPVTTKILTNNKDLDNRKVKISRPATGKINIEQVKQQISAFGFIEEFYEIRSNSRKRSFVVAFTSISGKIELLKRSILFIGTLLYSIENYVFDALESENTTMKKPAMLQIANISNSNTEFTVKI